jgi:hypothetical protein
MTDENDPTGEIAKLRAEVDALKHAQVQPTAPSQPVPLAAAPPKPNLLGRGCLISLAVIGGIFVLLIALASMIGSAVTTADPPTEAATTQGEAYKVGQDIATGDLKAKVTDVQITERIGGYLPTVASEGGQLVIVKFSLKNDTDKPVSAGEAPKLHLIDGAGTKYDEDAGKTGTYEAMHPGSDTKVWSDINPGITTHGAVVFEVSKETFDRSKWAILVGDDGPRVAFPPAP